MLLESGGSLAMRPSNFLVFSCAIIMFSLVVLVQHTVLPLLKQTELYYNIKGSHTLGGSFCGTAIAQG